MLGLQKATTYQWGIMKEVRRKSQTKGNILVILAIILTIWGIGDVYGADAAVFTDAFTKISGWVTGGLGKLVVGISVILSVIMGIAGFKWQQILIPLVLGLLLGSISGIVGLFF